VWVIHESYDPTPVPVPWWRLLLFGEPWIVGRVVRTTSFIPDELLSDNPDELEVRSVLHSLTGYVFTRIYTAYYDIHN